MSQPLNHAARTRVPGMSRRVRPRPDGGTPRADRRAWPRRHQRGFCPPGPESRCPAGPRAVGQDRRPHPRPVFFPMAAHLRGPHIDPVHRVLGEVLDTATTPHTNKPPSERHETIGTDITLSGSAAAVNHGFGGGRAPPSVVLPHVRRRTGGESPEEVEDDSGRGHDQNPRVTVPMTARSSCRGGQEPVVVGWRAFVDERESSATAQLLILSLNLGGPRAGYG